MCLQLLHTLQHALYYIHHDLEITVYGKSFFACFVSFIFFFVVVVVFITGHKITDNDVRSLTCVYCVQCLRIVLGTHLISSGLISNCPL